MEHIINTAIATAQLMAAINQSWPMEGSSHNSTCTAVIKRFIRAHGNSTFHARLMIWSTRSLGKVALTQSNMNQKNHTFIKNQRCDGRTGPSHPFKNNVAIMAETPNGAMNSASWNVPHFIPLYSVWNPATSSESASTMSNGDLFISAEAAIAKMKNPNGCNRMKGNLWASTISTSESDPDSIST
ncbi:uncharacterized protein METZ01_LOCUS278512, partial [marine metagenome]